MPIKFGRIIKRCCNDDNKNLKCGEFKEDNYITVNFINECNYPNGFMNKFRTSIEKIVLDDEVQLINGPLKIGNNSELKIYFDSKIENISYFFSSECDPNVININSIDFTNFDYSNIIDMSHLFEGCSSLESVDLLIAMMQW